MLPRFVTSFTLSFLMGFRFAKFGVKDWLTEGSKVLMSAPFVREGLALWDRLMLLAFEE